MKATLAIFCLFFFTVPACKPPSDSSSDTKGLYQAGATWSGAKASVCFANHAMGSEALRREIRDTLEQEINQRTVFRFTGFGACSENPQAQIEVRIKAKGRASAGGVGDTRNGIFQLLSHFVPANQLRSPMNLYLASSDGSEIDAITRHNIIVHEFGHALGLHHEQLRSDNKNGVYCNDDGGGWIGWQPWGSQKVGEYDNNSIMNYCNSRYFTEYLSLSAGDLATISKAYANETAAGDNLGLLLRCAKGDLVGCIQSGGGKSCVAQHCDGGAYVCENKSALEECLLGQGGVACLAEKHGKCRG